MRTTFLILTLSVSTVLYSQNFTIANQLANIVYVGIDNPLSVSVNNCFPKAVVLKTNNGKLVKYKNGGYNYMPSSNGQAEVDVYVKTNGKLTKIGKHKFLANDFPIPVAMVGGSTGGEIKKKEFAAQLGVRTENVMLFEASGRVDSFSIIILKQDSTYFIHKNISAAFDLITKDALSQLQAGDRIFITDIKATLANKKSASTKSLEFTISE